MDALFPRGLVGLIFDCDGVMIDSRYANCHFYNRILDLFGLPRLTPEQEVFAHMAASRQVLERFLPPDCLARVGEVVEHGVNYRRDIMPLITLMPGFVDFAADMHARGLRLAVSTNRTGEGMQDVLDHFSLAPIYEPVMTVSNAAPKPRPDAALTVCRTWGAEPAQVLMVGDSPSDREAALAAGVCFCAFGESDLEGDIKARDFTALRAALQPFMRV